MYLYIAILAIMTVIVVVIAAKSEMLRNEVFNPANFSQIANSAGIKTPRAAFSLGRSQLAFWTVIIVSTFVYVLIEKSSTSIVVPVLDGVNLALLGIAAGTTVVAKVIDNSQKDAQGNTIPQQDYPSKDFLTDIISDEKGVSIHRLQNVIWTIVVGSIYIAYVINRHGLEIPDGSVITAQLLGLMGISTGAYLGLKTAENKGDPAPSNTTNTNAAVSTPPQATANNIVADVSNSAQHEF